MQTTAITNKSMNTNDGAATFEYTGKNSFSEFDANGDHKPDYLFVNLGINVLKPGFIGLYAVNYNVTLGNNSPIVHHPWDYQGEIPLDGLINVSKVGESSLGSWIGFGLLLNGMTNIQNYNGSKIYFSIYYQFYNVTQQNYISTDNAITSPVYNFNIQNTHNFDLNTSFFGLTNSSNTFDFNQLKTGRSSSDQFKWKEHDFYQSINSNTDTNIINQTYFNTITFDYVNAKSLSYNYKQAFPNGTLLDDSQFYCFQSNGLNGWDTTYPIHYFIPVNSTFEMLKSYFDAHYKFENNISIPDSTIPSNISYQQIGNYFQVSMKSNNYIRMFNYYLPLGLLSGYNYIEYNSTGIVDNYSLLLISPNYGMLSVPVKNKTTPFIDNPLYLTPIALYAVVIRKKNLKINR